MIEADGKLNTEPDENALNEGMTPDPRFRKKSFAKTSTVYQMEITECGAASLSMVMGYYGVHVSIEKLRVQTGVSRNGVNAKNICAAANRNGFIANGYRREIDRLIKNTAMPCIIHWDFRHFVVLEGYRFGKFYINDPATGRRTVSYEEMSGSYTGVVLEIIPTANIVKQKNERTFLRFSANRLISQNHNLLVLFLLGVCLIVPGIIVPLFTRLFLDDVLSDGERSLFKWVLFGMIFAALYKAYFTYIKTKFSELFRNRMTLESSDKLLHHMFRLPLAFFEQRSVGDLVQRVENDAEVSRFLTGDIVVLGVSLITSMVYLVIMFFYDVKLTFIGLGFSILSMAAVFITSRKTAEYAQLYGIDNGQFAGTAYSGIVVSSSLKAAGAENEYASKVLGYSAMVQKSDQKLGKIQHTLSVIPEAISAFNNMLVLIVGSKLIIDGQFTPGLLMAFTGFLASFSEPFSDIVNFARGIHQLKNDMGRVDDLEHYKEDERYIPSEDCVEIEGGKLRGEVELKDISFAYGSLDRPLLKDLDLKLEKGKSVALVGSSGSGKSTVAKLITSLYKPWSGEILFDGINADRIPTDVIASSIAMVTQNIVIFEGSIYDNITAWNSSITQEDVVRAARDACIHDDITLKAGAYGHILKAGGSNISGGQRQRIEIARALAGNPSILVLDEATSFLDTLTEKKIYENIKKRGCTCIIVAQRLSSIKDCDEIIVFKNGRVIERGTHNELMEKKESYYELVRKADN